MSEETMPTSIAPRRRFAPEPVETTVKKSRRFAVEPVETTTRSNKKEEVQKIEDPSDMRDFVPTKRRFAPEPVETTFKSSKQVPKPLPTPELTPNPITRGPPAEDKPKPRRKFAPQLIETIKRSKKAGDPRPATLPTDKTDITPGTNHIYVERPPKIPRPPAAPIPPANTPNVSSLKINTTQIPPFPPRRQGSMKPHPNTRRSTRQNSFQPELTPILSAENEDSDGSKENMGDIVHSLDDGDSTPSLTGSLGSSEDSIMKLQLARTRESCDERFSGYLLALAAKAAEKQLREQALAAFPNESSYEIVEHFYDREVEGSSDDEKVDIKNLPRKDYDEIVGRLYDRKAPEEEHVEAVGMLDHDDLHIRLQRQPTEIGWAVKEMQEHQEKLNRMREEETNQKIAAEATAPTFQDPFWTNGMTEKVAVIARSGKPADKQKEAELDRMRSAASPPMLGGDLKFRMCLSPKATKFESDQKIDVQPNRSENGGGLWGGYCVAEEAGEYLSPSIKGPPMLQTPQVEREDPFSSAFASEVPGGTRSPRSNSSRSGVQMLTGIDERLKAEVTKTKNEESLLEEFNDTFVTQVYNYLSLGYPSLARQYDEELAKISLIPEKELRSDDRQGNAKGHIGLVDTGGSEGTRLTVDADPEAYGARWKALRVYIFEWARQHPSMANGVTEPSAWGVRARRGSWAI
ncbi:hypothetical protein B7494_g5380 [Chlorociboria aeruginascens]|nr:hypothetical protein B7494_g5380 [Chlorociboria aeruginascens]